MAAFMKLGDIKGEFAPSRQVEDNGDQVAQFKPGDVRDHNHGNRTNWDVICDLGTAIKQTSVADALTNYRINGDADSETTFDPKTGDKLGPVMDPIIDPNETYDVAIQGLIDDMMTGFMKLDDIRGEFDAGENEKVDVTYRLKDVIITSFDNSDALTNYRPVAALIEELRSDHIVHLADDAIVGTTGTDPFSELDQGFVAADPFSALDQGFETGLPVGSKLRNDNRFVFEPLNAMTSFGDSVDPGLDGANGFKPREVAAVEIGQSPEPKLWLQMLD